ncbi:MAG: DUF1801 domain-containing protein [Salibacteraceae bacterium]
MAKLKTAPNAGDVTAFLAEVADDQKRKDCETLLTWMSEITGSEAQLWGPSIVGFGDYHYRYASGREGDWFLTGFSPRKQNLTLYLMSGFEGYEDLLAKLGKYKTGKSCLYIKRLEDVNAEVLQKLVAASVNYLKATYPSK